MVFQQNFALISDLEEVYLSLYIFHIFFPNPSKQNCSLALISHHIKTVLDTERDFIIWSFSIFLQYSQLKPQLEKK